MASVILPLFFCDYALLDGRVCLMIGGSHSPFRGTGDGLKAGLHTSMPVASPDVDWRIGSRLFCDYFITWRSGRERNWVWFGGCPNDGSGSSDLIREGIFCIEWDWYGGSFSFTGSRLDVIIFYPI